MRNKRGSNQYQIKYRGLRLKTWFSIILILLILSPIVYACRQTKLAEIQRDHNPLIVYAKVVVTPTPIIENPTIGQQAIISEIKRVFGKDSDRAFRLLKCENPSLNPGAISQTKDYGIFQINSHWQGVSNVKFLLNPAINIRVAKQLFDESKSFKLWTCERRQK